MPEHSPSSQISWKIPRQTLLRLLSGYGGRLSTVIRSHSSTLR